MSAFDDHSEVTQCAERLAASLADEEQSFEAAGRRMEQEYQRLLNAVRQVHQRFAFDRDGRPGAIHAVREALPLMQRDLFDAVVEDHACELAAVEEALYQVARALKRSRTGQST